MSDPQSTQPAQPAPPEQGVISSSVETFASEIGNRSPIFIPPTGGVRTTEFWLAMLTNVLAVASTAIEQSNAPWALMAAGIINAIYITLRGALKNGYTQRAASLQKISGTLTALFITGLSLATVFMFSSCNVLGDASVNFARDEFDLTIKQEEGISTYYYLHRETERQFRAVNWENEWVVEAFDPLSGLWIKKGGAKSGLEDLVNLPLPSYR